MSLQRPAGPAREAYDPQGWEEDVETSERYLVRPVRPAVQLAVRIGLWTAVGLGCLGGIVGLLRPAGSGSEPVAEASTNEETVPAPAARVAELVVEEWLTATSDDQDRLDGLFVETPSLSESDTTGLTVDRVTTLAGRRVADGYWAITVAADVTEAVVGDEGDEDDEEPASVSTRWFVEVAIVGDVEQGLAALTTPAVMPLPPTLPDEVHATGVSLAEPADDDTVANAVEGFLRALLAGDGDPTRYLAPGVAMTPADPAPFVDVRMERIATSQLDEETEIWILAEVVATTPGGTERSFTYDLYAVAAVDRWEIVALSGVPTRTVQPVTEPEPATEPEAGS